MNSPAASSSLPPPSRVPGLAAALPLLSKAFVDGITPPAPVTVSRWAADHRMVAAESGSPFPGKWSNDLVPYLPEVMDCLSLSHPAREVTFCKAAQIAGSEAGINAIGCAIDKTPAPIIVVLPTLDEGKKYVKVKLQPTIDETPALRAKVREQKSRDEDGSTTSFKKFRGGFVQVTGANSSRGLKMVSARLAILEEVTEFPFDVDNQGDPVDLTLKRLTAWAGREKVFYNSTPGIKGMCRVTAKFEASDQRHYHVPCPHCGELQPLQWDRLKFTAETAAAVDPAKVWYACAANGCVIEHHHKAAMLAAGKWIAKFPNQGRQPGFHINQLYSPFVSWSDTVRAWLDAKDKPAKLKVFIQQVLGEAWEAKGDAPPWEQLKLRRENYRARTLPVGVLLVTMGVDVQKDRLEYGVWGWGVGETSWLIEKGVIEGDTTLPATWAELTPVIATTYPDAYGNQWRIDRVAVDSAYNTKHVFQWCRRRPRVIAVRGIDGANEPPIRLGQAQDIATSGKPIRRGMRPWLVGQWQIKADFYENLDKTIKGPQATGGFPPGYVHFGSEADDGILKQLTSEHLVTRTRNGFPVQMWVKGTERNEALDIRVYAYAAAAHMGMQRFTAAKWTELAAQRAVPQEAIQADLDALWGQPAAKAVATPASAPQSPVEPSTPAPAAAAEPERKAEPQAVPTAGAMARF